MEKEEELFAISVKKEYFEATLIYLACWCDNWKLSDLYGEDKGFVSGKKESLYANTQKRINILTKSGVPIETKRIDESAPIKGSTVRINKEEVIEDFITEINLESKLTIDRFNLILSKALPLIWIHITCFQQSRTFANENFKPAIENFVSMMGGYPKCVKYFPIWLSFNPVIQNQNGFINGTGRKWELEYTRSSVSKLPSRVILHLLWQIPGLRENMEKLFPDSLYLDYPREGFILEKNLKRFKDAFPTKTNGSLGFLDDENEYFVILLRLTRATIEKIIPGKFEYYQKNKKDFNLRAQVFGKLILDFFVLPVFSVDNIDYEKNIQVVVNMPGRTKPFSWNVPLKDVLEDFKKVRE